jgi:hypothetical protein
MRFFAAFVLLAISFSAYSDEREIQRALIQRDQQSAEFAARGIEARRGLENLHANQLRDAGQPLSSDPVIARQLRSYERERMAHERELVKPAEVKKSAAPDYQPLPLPGSGGPPVLVQPISTPSIGG